MSTGTNIIKTVLPWLGSALGGPLAPIIAGFVAKKLDVPAENIESTITSMLGNPEALAKLKEIESDTQIKLQEMGYQSLKDLTELEVRAAEAVNKTMQNETTAEHWPQYSWRPFIGFMFGFYIASLWILPLFGKQPTLMSPDIVMTVGAILGITAFFRGKAQADPDIPQATRILPQKSLASKVSEKLIPSKTEEIFSSPNATNVTPAPNILF